MSRKGIPNPKIKLNSSTNRNSTTTHYVIVREVETPGEGMPPRSRSFPVSSELDVDGVRNAIRDLVERYGC